MRARAISLLHPALLRQGEVKQEANIERYIYVYTDIETQMFEEKSGIVISCVNRHF